MSKLWNFNLPFFHGKSTTIDWIPNDSKKEFEKHISMYPDSEHLNNYKNNPIKYKLNNYGFRTDDDFFDESGPTEIEKLIIEEPMWPRLFLVFYKYHICLIKLQLYYFDFTIHQMFLEMLPMVDSLEF